MRPLLKYLLVLGFFALLMPLGAQLSLQKPHDASGKDLSGDRQMALVDSRLPRPLTVLVLENEKPVKGIYVAYRIVSQPEDISSPVKIEPVDKGISDEQGLARFNVLLGNQPGEYQLLFYPQRPDLKELPVANFTLIARSPSWGNWLLLYLIGGLAIFLLGMKTGAQGLQEAGGRRLRRLMTRLTYKPFLGVGVGLLFTMLTQSSSASTAMFVSFVSAKLMSFAQSLSLIVGSAIGTTITVQLISFDVMRLALPMIGLGFFMNFILRQPGAKAVGNSIMGFGLIFFGLKVMSDAVAPLAEVSFFSDAMVLLRRNPEWAFVLSTIFTAIVQCSGATLGLLISLSHHELITLEQAVPLILGANVGTCVTAILASLNASREAKRVAFAHLFYKLIGVAIFFPFLALLAHLGSWFTEFSSKTFIPIGGVTVARQIANTHTLFNIIIALLFLPFLPAFASLMEKIIPDTRRPDEELRTKYLDLRILETPVVALGSALRELSRMGRFVQEQLNSISSVLFEKDESKIPFIRQRDNKVDMLQANIVRFLADLTQRRLSSDERERSIALLYVVSDLENIGDIVDKDLVPIGQKMILNQLEFSEEGKKELLDFYHRIVEDLSRVVIALSTWNRDLAQEVLNHKDLLADHAATLHLNHLKRLQAGLRETVETSSKHLDLINYFQRIEFHCYRIATVITGKMQATLREGSKEE